MQVSENDEQLQAYKELDQAYKQLREQVILLYTWWDMLGGVSGNVTCVCSLVCTDCGLGLYRSSPAGERSMI